MRTALIFCFVFGALASSQAENNLLFTVRRETNGLSADCVFRIDAQYLKREPLEAGLKTRMLFTIQLMDRRRGLFSFLGDAMVGERTVEFKGYKDFLEDAYVLERGDGTTVVYKRPEDFFLAFTRLDRFPLTGLARTGENDRFYLRAQVRYFPVILLAPLTFVYVFSSRDVIESEWKSAALPWPAVEKGPLFQ